MRGQPVNATVVDQARALVESGVTLRDASTRLGVNYHTLYDRLNRPGRSGSRGGSLKQALLQTIADQPGLDAPTLAATVGTDTHTAVHLIYSLQKQNLVRFDERKGTNGSSVPRNVTSRAVEVLPPATVETIDGPAPLEPGVDLSQRPALRDLRERAVKAAKLAAAAALLEEAGEDEMALELLARSTFTPLETEVIALLKEME